MTPTRKLVLGLTMTAAAGFADAIGFIELGGYYVSFMSGNTTQLGDALAHAAWPAALFSAFLVALFFLGSFVGSALALMHQGRGQAYVLALILLSLALALILSLLGIPAQPALLPLAFAAGAQNAAIPTEGSARLGATFVTGTLFAAGQDLARALSRLAPPWRWAQHLLVWASLLLGAGLGALTYDGFGIWALLAPLVVYAGLLLLALRRA